MTTQIRPVRAQDQIIDVLHGEQPYADLSGALKSAIRIHVHLKAVQILDLPKSRRAAAGMAVPEDIRDLVREECKRLLKLRNS